VTSPPVPPEDLDTLDSLESDEQLVLGDLLNHVLDKGVVIQGSVVISIANIDLVALDLRLVLSSVESMARRTFARDADTPPP
jgi:gas vesicle structural protein